MILACPVIIKSVERRLNNSGENATALVDLAELLLEFAFSIA